VGVINVTDPGSQIQVSGRFHHGRAGDGGSGTLNVGAGGTVTVAGQANVWAAGTINLNAGGTLSLGGLHNGAATSFGAVNLAAGTTLVITLGTTTFGGVIGGAGGLTKSGAEVQSLLGANTYTGNTAVTAGWLRLAGSGSIAASPRITVGTAAGSSAILDVVDVTGGANFGNGGFALAAGQTLAGHGTVAGPVTVRNGSAVAPGTSVGTLHVAGMTWQGGGRYDFEYAGATGDRIDGNGQLALGALSSASRFTIDIDSFDPTLTGPQTFTIATFTGGISGFDATPGNPQFAFTGFVVPGSASLVLQGNSLVLTFTPVPEPAHLMLLGAAVAGAVRWGKRSQGSGVRSQGSGVRSQQDHALTPDP
jgi:fibronectin-binding autotransporter adhesin